MLKNIHPLLGPELLHVLASMGHGDELVIADRNFPSYKVGKRVIELRGHDAPSVAEAICTLMPLDVSVSQPAHRMATDKGESDIPPVHAGVIAAVTPNLANGQSVGAIERFAFYERAADAFAVIVTGETRPYGDFILCMGVA